VDPFDSVTSADSCARVPASLNDDVPATATPVTVTDGVGVGVGVGAGGGFTDTGGVGEVGVSLPEHPTPRIARHTTSWIALLIQTLEQEGVRLKGPVSCLRPDAAQQRNECRADEFCGWG
jgi:hypothetical protein